MSLGGRRSFHIPRLGWEELLGTAETSSLSTLSVLFSLVKRHGHTFARFRALLAYVFLRIAKGQSVELPHYFAPLIQTAASDHGSTDLVRRTRVELEKCPKVKRDNDQRGIGFEPHGD